jgi:C1A family cysteine protease
MFRALGILLFLSMPAWAQQTGSDTKTKPLPSKFDLRSVNGVTPIKKQLGGTCWAHGTMAAIESNLIMSGSWKSAGLDGIPACSEYHLDWWNGFNKHKNLDLTGEGEGKTGLTVHQGGDYRVSAAYMTRGEGIVLVPRGADKELNITGWHKSPPAQDDPSYKRFYPRDIEWFVVGDKLENIDNIKRRIMTHGAIGTSYAAGKFTGKDNFHYQPESSMQKQNHAVAIVGWDDEKFHADEKIDAEKKAPKAGAWLIKNSWGETRGEKGYYWISYYDKHCGRDPEMGAVSFRNIEPMRYHHVYYHDYHGWRDTMKHVSKAFNAFTAVGHQKLESVSFYTSADNVTYTAKIYRKFEKGQLMGEIAVKTGTIPITGFHTIDLDKAIEVKEKEKFYVYVELSTGGHAFDRTSVIPVLLGQQKGGDSKLPLVISKAGPGESYYWDTTSKSWLDFYNYEFKDMAHNHTANFCMKALAVNANGKPTPRPVEVPMDKTAPAEPKKSAEKQSSFLNLELPSLQGAIVEERGIAVQ